MSVRTCVCACMRALLFIPCTSQVEVKVNGNVMPFYMTLDESGSAFFVEQVSVHTRVILCRACMCVCPFVYDVLVCVSICVRCACVCVHLCTMC